MLNYGDKRDYRKIDLFYNELYICSTTWAKTCKEAKAVLVGSKDNYGNKKTVQLFGEVDSSKLVAHFSK